MTGADVFPLPSLIRPQSEWTVAVPQIHESREIAAHESYWNGLRDGYIFGVVTIMIGGWVVLRNRVL